MSQTLPNAAAVTFSDGHASSLGSRHSSIAALHAYPTRLRHTCSLGSRRNARGGIFPGMPGLQRAAGAVRGLNASESGGDKEDATAAVRSFDEDCRVVEECNDLINARLDIPV